MIGFTSPPSGYEESVEGSLEGTPAEESHEARSSLQPGHPFSPHAAPGCPRALHMGHQGGPDKGGPDKGRAGRPDPVLGVRGCHPATPRLAGLRRMSQVHSCSLSG